MEIGIFLQASRLRTLLVDFVGGLRSRGVTEGQLKFFHYNSNETNSSTPALFSIRTREWQWVQEFVSSVNFNHFLIPWFPVLRPYNTKSKREMYYFEVQVTSTRV